MFCPRVTDPRVTRGPQARGSLARRGAAGRGSLRPSCGPVSVRQTLTVTVLHTGRNTTTIYVRSVLVLFKAVCLSDNECFDGRTVSRSGPQVARSGPRPAARRYEISAGRGPQGGCGPRAEH